MFHGETDKTGFRIGCVFLLGAQRWRQAGFITGRSSQSRSRIKAKKACWPADLHVQRRRHVQLQSPEVPPRFRDEANQRGHPASSCSRVGQCTGQEIPCAHIIKPQGLELEARPRQVCLDRPILDKGRGAALVVGRRAILADGVIFGLTETVQRFIVEANIRQIGQRSWMQLIRPGSKQQHVEGGLR